MFGEKCFLLSHRCGCVRAMCITNVVCVDVFGCELCVCFAVDLTNGQLTPNNNTPLLAQALSGEGYLTTHNKFISDL